MFKQLLIKNYEDLKSEIDIECEKILADPITSQEEVQKYNNVRKKFINEIDKVLAFNLNQIKFNNNDLKYCFIKLKQSNTRKLGVLIITNYYIQPKLCPKDKIYAKIFNLMFEENLSDDKEVLDFSIRENNKLKLVDLNSESIRLIAECDQNLFENVINPINIELCCLNFKWNDKLTKKNLCNFKKFLNLEIRFPSVLGSYEKDLLDDFDNLEKLSINNVQIKDDFFSMENLKSLKIYDGIYDPNETSPFKKLTNLECLYMKWLWSGNEINELTKPLLSGLNNLKYLYFETKSLSRISSDAFFDLKKLSCLEMPNNSWENISIDCLNCLENLEYLRISNKNEMINFDNLNLPSLKYLVLDTKKIPVFTQMKIKFLNLRNLNFFDDNLLERHEELRGLVLNIDKNLFNLIKKENFTSLNKLVYIRFDFHFQVSKELIDQIKANEECIKIFVNGQNIRFFSQFGQNGGLIEVSSYDKIKNLLNNEIGINGLVEEIASQNHQYNIL